MSTKSENIVYFSDGHTEPITSFEISKDGHDIWFTVESGRWFIHKEEIVDGPECKFYEVKINRECVDEFGLTCDIQYIVTDEIDKIKICAVE